MDAGVTQTDLAMMARAIGLARAAAEQGEVPIGAVVYETDTGRVLGEGANTRERLRDPCGHAELIAIRAAAEALGDWRLNDCSLAVTLEPCPMCAGAIVNARLGRVLYGADDPKAGAVRSLFNLLGDERLNHRCVVIPGVEQAACAAMLTGFFRLLRERKSFTTKDTESTERNE
ncbi:MAG: nucleoside deaminase [Phycisphaerales bacterium]|nr:nucleoside deaminase [Planctomycetota bacterium]MCH8508079.1 nucleoside deaminase [Phycisphaerales bacterium]